MNLDEMTPLVTQLLVQVPAEERVPACAIAIAVLASHLSSAVGLTDDEHVAFIERMEKLVFEQLDIGFSRAQLSETSH